jgi:4-oxalocrotonate tautomerase
MPFVNLRTARGLLNAEQKRQLHSELTEVLVRIEGGGDPAFRQFVTVLIEEHDQDCWSIAGTRATSLLEEMK